MNQLKLLNQNVPALKVIVFTANIFPGLWLFYLYWSDQLGINGLETLLHTTGFTALILYMITLSITPLRRVFSHGMILLHRGYGKRLGDWNWMVRLRRMLGVFCFLYALLHFLIFFYFELDFHWPDLWLETRERPFILVGMFALLMLLPLFLTSSDLSMRLLKKNWRRLHRLMYPIGILIAVHYLWLTKPGVFDAYPYALIIFVLLLFRLLASLKLIFVRVDDGMLSRR